MGRLQSAAEGERGSIEANVSLPPMLCLEPKISPLEVDLWRMTALGSAEPTTGVLVLFTDEAWNRARAEGWIDVRFRHDPAFPTVGRPDVRHARKMPQSQLLDLHRVRQGDKAIAQWLDRHWRGELLEKWGPPDSPGAIRKFRSRRARRAVPNA